MSLTPEQVKAVAHLARLAVNEEDVPRYVQELSSILDMVEKLEQAPADDVVPMAHPLDVSQRMRADDVTESNQRDDFQAIAPAVESGYYVVPKVIE